MFFKFFLCGLLAALPFVFPALWPISWVALVPAAFMLMRKGSEIKKRKAYLYGLGFGFGYFGVMFYWFTCLYPMEFAGLGNFESLVLVCVCWFGLALLQSIEFGFVTLLYRLIRPDKNKIWLCALLFSALWVVFEWQQTLFWRGVPWARLAVSQSAVPFLQQSASLLGGLFTGAIIASVNAFIAAALYSILGDKPIKELPGVFLSGIRKKKTIIFASVSLGIFTFNAVFGAIRCLTYDVTSDRKLTAAVIQGNISSLDKWADDSVERSARIYLDLTEKCVNETGAELVVWPESVITANLRTATGVSSLISAKAKELDITLFVGAYDIETAEDEKKYYNSIYIFYPDGSVGENTYKKQHLVPFGEYTPMEELIKAILPVLYDINILSDPFTPGTESEVFDTEYGKIGSLICFDSIYETLALNSVRDGAELITLSTNDSWFRDSAAVYQHNSHACLRAIENGRYVVRAANTGVSTIISPKGETLTLIDPLTEGFAAAEVYMKNERTLYSYTGNLFVYVCIAFISAVLVYSRVKDARKRETF